MVVRSKAVGEDPVILPRGHNGTEPQHLLLALLGDYWFTRPEPLPSAALLELLEKFDVKESSARQAMRRLAIKGHLVHYREGRKTSYGFPPRSDEVIRTRLKHVIGFGRETPAWDSCFTIAAFSVPEEQRDLRRELRTELLSLGFGNLQDAVWITPHDKREAAVALFQELDIPKGTVFYGPEAGSRDPVALISEAFDTSHVRSLYESFIEEYEPLCAGAPRTDDALVTRTLMVNKWLTLRTVDPNLPVELLPADWPRLRAHQIFVSLYDGLGPNACAEFLEVVRRHDNDLAELVTYFTSEILES